MRRSRRSSARTRTATEPCGRPKARPRFAPWWRQPASRPARAPSEPCSARSRPDHCRSPLSTPWVITHRGSARLSQPVAPVFEWRLMIRYNTEAQPFLCRIGTFSWTVRFHTVSLFYLDVLDGDQVMQDLDGIDFADCEVEAAAVVAAIVAAGAAGW